MDAMEFHANMLTLASRLRFSTASGLRSAHRNSLPSIKGQATSRHLQWCAADCVLDPDENADLFKSEVKRLNMKFLDEGDHIHVQTP